MNQPHPAARRGFRALTAFVALASTSAAQTYDWSSRFGSKSPNFYVHSVQAIDDASGAGQVVYVGGSFTWIGGCRANSIARWDGVAWSALGDGLGATSSYLPSVSAITQFDAGSGPEIVAGGLFMTAGAQSASSLARWNGASWATLQGASGEGVVNGFAPGQVKAMQCFDDGSGDAVWITGVFTSAGGSAAAHVARWNGVDWLPVDGLSGGSSPGGRALAVFDDGTGPHLYIGGSFNQAGSTPANNIARWNGTGWEPVGAGLNSGVTALGVFDDGTGAKLYAGGGFTGFLESWDGVQWSSVGSPPNSIVEDFTVFDDGSGPALYASGPFSSIGGIAAPRLAKWDGTSWSNIGGVMAGGVAGIPSSVTAVDFGPHGGRRLLIGGLLVSAGPVAGNEIATPYLAQWDGSAWSGFATTGDGLPANVLALAVHDDGRGDALYAAGAFTPGDLTVTRIKRWDGEAWETLGGGANDIVFSLASFDDGGGAQLYAGGWFTSIGGVATKVIARWDGASWSSVGGGAGAQGVVHAMQAFDDGTGPALYVGGGFASMGGVAVNNVARWNGSTWSALGSGITGTLHALAVFDDGSGPALYAAGGSGSGSSVQGRFLRWNGVSWTSLGGAIDDVILALQPFDDGSGPALYVGGEMLFAGGVAVDHLAKWNGSGWSSVLSTPLPRRALSMTVYDDGHGPRLHVGGQAQFGGGFVGRVEGSQLVPLREQPSGQVHALAEFADGRSARPPLYIGGAFDGIGTLPSKRIGRWADSDVAPAASYCTAGTTANGCAATMSATGEPSRCANSGFDIEVTGVEGQKLGIVFFGYGQAETHWGAGTSYVCVAPPTLRASMQTSGGTTGACDGAFALDFNAWMYANPFKAPAPGTDVFMQAWFRDPPSPKGTSLSDALQFEVAP